MMLVLINNNNNNNIYLKSNIQKSSIDFMNNRYRWTIQFYMPCDSIACIET